jgi:hypothetical protein
MHYYYYYYYYYWSLTLREERGFRGPENRVQRIFGRKNEITGDNRRKLHNDELRNMYTRMDGQSTYHARGRTGTHTVLVEMLDGK